MKIYSYIPQMVNDLHEMNLNMTLRDKLQ